MTGIILIVIGVFTLAMTILKPPFYWGSRKALRMRRLFGDSLASTIYLIVAIVLIYFGYTML